MIRFYQLIKPHRRTQKFSGTLENAVNVQIGTAVSIYVLVAIVKKRFNLVAALYPVRQIGSVTPFEKIPFNKDVLDRKNSYEDKLFRNQLNLFDSSPDTSDAPLMIF